MILATSVAVLILASVHKVCPGRSQVTVQEGDPALLPCVYTGNDLPTNPTVIWKDPKDNTLLTVEKAKVQTFGNVQTFQTFPNQHSSGNFSIEILKVTPQNDGIYECYVKEVDFQENIHLSVTEKRLTTEDPSNGGAAVHLFSGCVFVISTVFYLCI